MIRTLRILLLAIGSVLITVGVVAMHNLVVSPAARMGPGWVRGDAIVVARSSGPRRSCWSASSTLGTMAWPVLDGRRRR
jgi:hypothetical protein